MPRPPAGWSVGSGHRSAPAFAAQGVRIRESWHRPLTWFSVLMVGWGVVSTIGLLTDQRLLGGDPIWAKPVKFTISLAVYSLTLAWMHSAIRNVRLRRLSWWAGTLGAIFALLEISVITLQVIRGTSSHFNISTPFDKSMYLLMGSGVVFLFGAVLVIGTLLVFSHAIEDRSVLWALRLGLLIGVAGLSVGFLMTIPTALQLATPHVGHVGSHSVGGDDPTGGLFFLGWNSEHGDLRVSHFIGMHALQVLPLLAILLRRVFGPRWGEATRVHVVMLVAAIYASVTALTLWQALRGQSVVKPDAVTLTAAVILATGVTGFALLIFRRAHTILPTTESAATPWR
jgi:uncharacterized membrane protein